MDLSREGYMGRLWQLARRMEVGRLHRQDRGDDSLRLWFGGRSGAGLGDGFLGFLAGWSGGLMDWNWRSDGSGIRMSGGGDWTRMNYWTFDCGFGLM